MLSDRVQQLLRHLVGVSVQEADPLRLRRFDLREALEQRSQAVLQTHILAEAGGVLPDEADLPNALRKQPRGLGDYRFEAPAAKGAAILRNHAERAGMIATLGDLDIGEVLRRG